jgi:hypothetical protein
VYGVELNGVAMILPDLQILSFRLAEQKYLSSDSPERPKFNKNYQYPIHYSFNSRGFRDVEWPETIEELKNSIWCVGDSATVGLGSPLSHTWPAILQDVTQTRTINISLSGIASDWIFRQTQQILEQIQPRLIVVQWTFLHRRDLSIDQVLEKKWQQYYTDIKDPSWPKCKYNEIEKLPQWIQEEILSTHEKFSLCETEFYNPDHQVFSDQENIQHTLNYIKILEESKNDTKLIHSVIPQIDETLDNPSQFDQEIKKLPIKLVPRFQFLDYARDGFHWDIETSKHFVQLLLQTLN